MRNASSSNLNNIIIITGRFFSCPVTIFDCSSLHWSCQSRACHHHRARRFTLSRLSSSSFFSTTYYACHISTYTHNSLMTRLCPRDDVRYVHAFFFYYYYLNRRPTTSKSLHIHWIFCIFFFLTRFVICLEHNKSYYTRSTNIFSRISVVFQMLHFVLFKLRCLVSCPRCFPPTIMYGSIKIKLYFPRGKYICVREFCLEGEDTRVDKEIARVV